MCAAPPPQPPVTDLGASRVEGSTQRALVITMMGGRWQQESALEAAASWVRSAEVPKWILWDIGQSELTPSYALVLGARLRQWHCPLITFLHAHQMPPPQTVHMLSEISDVLIKGGGPAVYGVVGGGSDLTPELSYNLASVLPSAWKKQVIPPEIRIAFASCLGLTKAHAPFDGGAESLGAVTRNLEHCTAFSNRSPRSLLEWDPKKAPPTSAGDSSQSSLSLVSVHAARGIKTLEEVFSAERVLWVWIVAMMSSLLLWRVGLGKFGIGSFLLGWATIGMWGLVWDVTTLWQWMGWLLMNYFVLALSSRNWRWYDLRWWTVSSAPLYLYWGSRHVNPGMATHVFYGGVQVVILGWVCFMAGLAWRKKSRSALRVRPTAG